MDSKRNLLLTKQLLTSSKSMETVATNCIQTFMNVSDTEVDNSYPIQIPMHSRLTAVL